MFSRDESDDDYEINFNPSMQSSHECNGNVVQSIIFYDV